MKNLKVGSFIATIVMTLFIMISIIHNTSNERFPVEHKNSIAQKWHENSPELYTIQISPAAAWDYSHSSARTFGYICLVILWVLTICFAADLHLRFFKSVKSRAPEIIFATFLVLCVSLFLGSSSSVFSNNYVSVRGDQFRQWIYDQKIEQRGEKTWIDTDSSRVLYSLFNKELIR